MRKLALLLTLFFLCVQSAYALEPPAHTGWVVDRAHVFSNDERRTLSKALAKIQRNTGGHRKGAQVAVLTIPSLEGDDLKDFSIRTARRWGLGSKGAGSLGKSNGLLILIVTGKNTKERYIRLEVGTGLEGALPDGKVGTLTRELRDSVNRGENLAPPLGIMVEALAEIIYKESGVSQPKIEDVTVRYSDSDARLVSFALAIFVTSIIGSLFHRRKRFLRYWFGGVLGSASWVGLAHAMSVELVTILGLGTAGYLLGYLLSAMIRNGFDGLNIWTFPSPGGGSASSDHSGSGGDFAGAGSDSTFTEGVLEGISNIKPPSDCGSPGDCTPDIGGCEPGGC